MPIHFYDTMEEARKNYVNSLIGGKMKILVTGFTPFNGETRNPSLEILSRLPVWVEGHEITTLVVPTVFKKSIEVLKDAIEREKPHQVICIGQAGGEAALRLEKVAINLEEARIADNEGNQPLDSPVVEGGDKAYFTNLPLKAMKKSLYEAGIPAVISYTAGTFVCNHLFYGLMDIIKDRPGIRGGFVHVPYTPDQVVDKPGMAHMSLDMMVNGIINIIGVACRIDNDIKDQTGKLD